MKEDSPLWAAAGAVLLASAVGASLWSGQAPAGLLSWLGLLPWPMTAWALWRSWRASRDWPAWLRLPAALVVVALLLTALAPLTGWDGLGYHLSLPRLFLREPGSFWNAYDHRYTFIPLMGEMLFTVSLPWSEASAQLWLPLGYLACFWSVLALAGIWGGKPRTAALLFLGGLPFAKYAAGGYVDILACAAVGLALVAYLRWEAEGSWVRLASCGLLSGAAASLKMTGLPFLGLMGLAVGALSWRRRSPQSLLLFLVTAGLVALPWLLRAWIATGNPIYPLGAGLWGGPFLNLRAGYALGRLPGPAGWGIFLSLLLLSAPWLAFLLLCRLQSPLPRVRGSLLVMTLTLVIPFWAVLAPVEPVDISRYALPYCIPACAWAALALEGLRAGALLRLCRLASGAALAACPLWVGARAAQRLPVVLGLESREAFLTRRCEPYAADAWLNALGASGRTVRVFLAGCRGYYLDVPYVEAHDAHAYVDYAKEATMASLVRRARAEGLTHILVELDPASGSQTFQALLARDGLPHDLVARFESPGAKVYEILPEAAHRDVLEGRPAP